MFEGEHPLDDQRRQLQKTQSLDRLPLAAIPTSEPVSLRRRQTEVQHLHPRCRDHYGPSTPRERGLDDRQGAGVEFWHRRVSVGGQGFDAPICQDSWSRGFKALVAFADICHDALVDLASQKAFQTPDDVPFRPAICGASDDIVDRRLVIPHADHDGSMEGGVRSPMAAPIESVSAGGHAGRGGDWTRAAELGKSGFRANPLGIVPEDNQQGGRGVGADGEALPEGGGRLGGESLEVPVMRRHFVGEGQPATGEGPERVLAGGDGRVESARSKSCAARDEGAIRERLQRLSEHRTRDADAGDASRTGEHATQLERHLHGARSLSPHPGDGRGLRVTSHSSRALDVLVAARATNSCLIPVAVTIYRHRATKNYQLDLFDPNDGHYEYAAVTSNLALTVRNLWYFACGRGNHEKTIAQLKTGLAFHSVPTQTYAANSAWQQLVVLAHNLLTNFQLETGAPQRRRTRKHTVVPLLQSVQTLRFELFHRAALLVRPGGKMRLRMTDNLPTRQTFTRIANALSSG